MNSILLTGPGIAPLLVPDMNGHRPAQVRRMMRQSGEWSPWEEHCYSVLGNEDAIPLLWRGKPCFSAIDAVVRAGEGADPREPLRGWTVWEEHRQSTDPAGILALARNAASVLSCEVVEVP